MTTHETTRRGSTDLSWAGGARRPRRLSGQPVQGSSTWTKKLDDPREAERAVTELEQLGDPSAIPALGKAWSDQGKPVRLLQVIIALARPLTPERGEGERT